MLNQALHGGLAIFEIAPLGGGAHLILQSEHSGAKSDSFAEDLITKNYESILFSKSLKVPEDILNTYLSLNNEALMDFLLIYEHEFVGNVFEMSAVLKTIGLKVVDLRMPRGFQQKSHAFFTGPKSCLDQVREIQNKDKIQFEIIENPHLEIRELFSFENATTLA